MKVLSLFDGMACGMIAMNIAGVDVESYDAYEIDKYALKVAKHNFPMIKQHGDVFSGDFTQYEGVDMLCGGSPCTHWSIAQTKNRETEVSRDEKGNIMLHSSGIGFELFSQYLRAIEEAKPKYFIYENNKSMSKEIRKAISECFGFEPICINSALVSAQNRQRLYWVGKRNADGTYSKVKVEQPEDRGILLKDVLDSAVAWRDKAYTIDANYYKATDRTDPFGGHQSNNRMMAAERIPPYGTGKSRPVEASYPSHAGCGEGSLEQRMFSPNPSKQQVDLIAEPIDLYANKTVDRACERMVKKFGYIPERFNPYNCSELTDKSPTLSTGSMVTSSCATLVHERVAEPINATVDGKSQTLKATPSGAVSPMFRNGTFGITGVAEPVQVGRMPREDGIVTDSKQYRIYSADTKAVTQCGQGGGLGAKTGLYAIPTMPVSEATSQGYTEIQCGDCVDLSMLNSKTRRGRNMENKSNCMQTSNEFYQYVGYAIEFDDSGNPIKAVGKDGKRITIYEVNNGQITIKDKQYPIKLRDGYYIIRKLTVSECKRLQTVPEWYDFSVISNSQAYKCLGNGWTCEVIAHLIKSCLKED